MACMSEQDELENVPAGHSQQCQCGKTSHGLTKIKLASWSENRKSSSAQPSDSSCITRRKTCCQSSIGNSSACDTAINL